MKKKKSYFKNFILFACLIVITFYVLLRDQNIGEIFEIIKNVKIEYVVVAIAFMFVYLSLEGFNIGRSLTLLGEKSSPLKNLKYSFIGFFFSSITPAASGGQPMQVYYMYKDGVAVANSTLALLINLTSMQITTISVALFSLIFNYSNMNTVLIVCFIVGIMLNMSALGLLVISIYSKRLSKWLINFALRVMKFFKVRNIDKKRERFEQELEKYQTSAVFLRNNRKHMFKVVCTTFIQFMFYYSITYWVYRALGFSGESLFSIIGMQAVLYGTVSGIPSPGAVGVSEGAFTEIFRNVYSKEFMSTAVLLNRGINFYLYVFVCAVVTIVNQFCIKEVIDDGVKKY